MRNGVRTHRARPAKPRHRVEYRLKTECRDRPHAGRRHHAVRHDVVARRLLGPGVGRRNQWLGRRQRVDERREHRAQAAGISSA